MGTGSVSKLLLQLALPAVVAQVVNLLYNIVDRIYIGHMADVGARRADRCGPVHTNSDADHRLCDAVRLRRCAARRHRHGARGQ